MDSTVKTSSAVPQRRQSAFGDTPSGKSHVVNVLLSAGSCTPHTRRPCHGFPTARDLHGTGGGSGAVCAAAPAARTSVSAAEARRRLFARERDTGRHLQLRRAPPRVLDTH